MAHGTEGFVRFDAADHLGTAADAAGYLEAALEESGDDSAAVARALDTIARHRMSD